MRKSLALLLVFLAAMMFAGSAQAATPSESSPASLFGFSLLVLIVVLIFAGMLGGLREPSEETSTKRFLLPSLD